MAQQQEAAQREYACGNEKIWTGLGFVFAVIAIALGVSTNGKECCDASESECDSNPFIPAGTPTCSSLMPMYAIAVVCGILTVVCGMARKKLYCFGKEPEGTSYVAHADA